MCTLTYIPKGINDYWWTHNRDESPNRKAKGIIHSEGLVYPLEPTSGGSWIGVSEDNRTVSLLNGAFEKTPYEPSQGKSRGVVVLDALKSRNLMHFFDEYDLEGVQPFTLIIRSDQQLWDFRWDTQSRYLKELDRTQPHIWSASMLYTEKWKEQRRKWFRAFIAERQSVLTARDIHDFHRNAGSEYPEQGLIMNRNVVRTVSITTILRHQDDLKIDYQSLVNDTTTHFKIEWKDGKKIESTGVGKSI
jgi:uncharacterized protein with NRDE domain